MNEFIKYFIFSGCVFSILFPLFIVSGNEAEPVTGVWYVSLLHFKIFNDTIFHSI